MRAIVCTEFGPPDKLCVQQVDAPQPAAGEVRVAVHACGVNFADTLIIQGLYQEKPPLPFTPGVEAAGVVEALGEGVDSLAVGDRVIALCGQGGFAEFVCCPAMAVIRIPGAMDFVTAAGFAVAYGTSHIALDDRAGLKPGDTLLVHGAGGGVGLAAVDIGRAMGAHVIATASSDSKRALASARGAEHVIDYSNGGFRDEVKALTDGRGVDVVYDPVGGAVFDESVRCLAWKGRLLVIGFASGTIPKLPANLALVKNISAVGVFWGAYQRNEPDTLRASMDTLFEMFAAGQLHPQTGMTYALEDAADALSALASRQSKSKLIIEMG